MSGAVTAGHFQDGSSNDEEPMPGSIVVVGRASMRDVSDARGQLSPLVQVPCIGALETQLPWQVV